MSARHPFDVHLDNAAVLSPQPLWTPTDGELPSLYISHGAPPLFEDLDWMTELLAWARTMPKPRAILIVSAHWESAPLTISASSVGTELVYDFGGFDPRYHRMRYDTPDAGELAQLVAGVLPDGQQLYQHPTRGLDHGAWVPLKVMYPDADVPVLQLSIPTAQPGGLLALGTRLRALREHGVLVIGSGFMTHGLPFLDWGNPHSVPGWSADFDAWAAEALATGDVDELAAFASHAPGMPYAHPSDEHFIPLFVTLGAASDPAGPVETVIGGHMMGLSRRSFQLA